MWIKPDNLTSGDSFDDPPGTGGRYGTLMGGQHESSNWIKWGFGFTTDGHVNVSHYQGGSIHNTSNLAINVDEWNHVSFMRSGGKIWLSCN